MCISIEQNKGRVADWDYIQWDKPKRHVRRLQERIFRATRDKDWAKAKKSSETPCQITFCEALGG